MEVKKRTAAEWLEVIGEQGRSGMSQRAWCEANGENYATFTKRLLVLRKRGLCGGEALNVAEGKKKNWVEIKPGVKAAADAADGLRVEVGAYRVIIPDAFSEAALRRVCKALAGIC